MNGVSVRAARSDDFPAIRNLLQSAFGGPDEANLVEGLRRDGDVVLELVASKDNTIVGDIVFSRLIVSGDAQFEAVALAPLAVLPDHQRAGVGGALVGAAHATLLDAGERLSVVLGDAAYYGRFGYEHHRAAGFECQYQGEHLQALAFADAPRSGTLVYAPAFGIL